MTVSGTWVPPGPSKNTSGGRHAARPGPGNGGAPPGRRSRSSDGFLRLEDRASGLRRCHAGRRRPRRRVEEVALDEAVERPTDGDRGGQADRQHDRRPVTVGSVRPAVIQPVLMVRTITAWLRYRLKQITPASFSGRRYRPRGHPRVPAVEGEQHHPEDRRRGGEVAFQLALPWGRS